MPIAELSKAHVETKLGFPSLPCVNMYYDDGLGALVPRAGLVVYGTFGSGPIRGQYYKSGLFNGDHFWVSGTQLWRGASIVGTIVGEGPVRIAGGLNVLASALVFVSSGVVYFYNGTTVAEVSIPDSTPIIDAVFYGSRFIYLAASGRFYFSDLNDPATVDALSFYTAEYQPDDSLRLAVSGGDLYIIGSATVEVWGQTGDSDDPFAPSINLRMEVGAFSGDLVLETQGAIFFVSHDLKVYALPGLQMIADDSILRAFKGATFTTASICALESEERRFIIITDKAGDSYVYDGANWVRWRKRNYRSLNIANAVTLNGITYAGDMETGVIYKFDSTVLTDAGVGTDYLCSSFIPLAAGVERMNSLALKSARGAGYLTLQNPLVEMRYSDDMGQTWGDWWATYLGGYGNYANYAKWHGLGSMRPHGRTQQFRCTDGVYFAPSAIIYNESRL